MEGKADDQNLLMIDQTGYPPQFTVEQLQLLSQLQVSDLLCCKNLNNINVTVFILIF